MSIYREGGLAEEVASSLGAASWLTESDSAAKRLAMTYARLIDEAEEAADDTGDLDELIRAAAVAGPNLQKTLSSLGLTAVDRGRIAEKSESKRSPVDELKQRRGAKAS